MKDQTEDKPGGDDGHLETLVADAEKGKEEAQLELGKHYLRQAEVDSSSAESGKECIRWLVKASRQGNEEATGMLRECLQKQLGVDESNLDDVTWCINTQELEKRARKAAQQLFRKMNPFSDQKTNLTKQEYLDRVMEFSQNKTEKKLLERAGKSDVISEEDFVNKVMRKLKGQGGLTLSSVLQNDVEWEAYSNATVLQKLTKYPGKTLVFVMDSTIDTAGSQGMAWLRSLLPVNQIYMLVILFIYSLISVAAIVWIVPLLGFYISFLSMTICTMQMFYNRKKLRDVKALAEMLERFNETFSQESAESAYSWSSLSPYVSFSVALLFTVLTFSAADKTWVPCSEFSLVSLVITVACFFALSDRYDYLAICSILLDNVAMLPMMVDMLPRIPVIYGVLDFVIGSGISIPLLPGMYVQLGIPSLAYLIVPLLFFRMAMQKSWHGTYQILIPHLVCFFWWRVTVMLFLEASFFGLIRASVGWLLFVILMPVVAISFALWIAYIVFKAFSITNILRIATTFVLLAVVGAFGYWSRGGFHIGSSLKLDSKQGKLFLAFVLLLSSVPLAFIVIPEEAISEPVYLPYEMYAEHCGKLRWESSSVAMTMSDCAHWTQTKVKWTGTVKQIGVKRIENQAESFIEFLPGMMSTWLKCTYGEEYSTECEALPDKASQDICSFNRQQGRICHLKNLNRYTFELSVIMADQSEVKLQASHWFKDAVLKVKPSDEISFRAYLMENLGNSAPILRLYNLRCLTCEDSEIEYSGTIFQQSGWNVLVLGKNALQAVWNFFLAPILVFKN